MVNRNVIVRIPSAACLAGLLLASTACSSDAEEPGAQASASSDVSSPTTSPAAPSDPASAAESTRAAEPAATPTETPEQAAGRGDDLAPPTAQEQSARGRGSGEYDLVLTDVRVGSHTGYDRIVMEFEGTGAPGWRVRYVQDPRLDGSGERVRLGGTSSLSIVADHTTYPGEDAAYYDGPKRLPGPGGPVTDAYVGGTFEGYTAVFAGVDGAEPPYRVFRLSDPVRLVVDVAAGS